MDPPKDKFAFMDELSNTIVIMKVIINVNSMAIF